MPCREPYTVAVRSVTLRAVPPSPEFCRSEILCAGFQIHSNGSSSCTVSSPAGPSCAPSPGTVTSPDLTVCKGSSKIPPKREFSLGVWSLSCPALANLTVRNEV